MKMAERYSVYYFLESKNNYSIASFSEIHYHGNDFHIDYFESNNPPDSYLMFELLAIIKVDRNKDLIGKVIERISHFFSNSSI